MNNLRFPLLPVLLDLLEGDMMPLEPLLCNLCQRFFVDLLLLLGLLLILFHDLLATLLLLALPDLFILVDPLQHLYMVIGANLTARLLSSIVVVGHEAEQLGGGLGSLCAPPLLNDL